MTVEPLQQVSMPISQQPKDRSRSRSVANEQAIRVCHDLLSSGHSLSEILIALKELGPLNKAQSDRVDAPAEPDIPHLAAELAAPLQWEILQVAERVEVSRTLVPLNVEPQQRACDEKKSGPLAVILFWLIPVMSIILLGISGKLLIDAGLRRNIMSATGGAETIFATPVIAEVGRSTPEPSTAVSADELAVTASPAESATQAAGTASDNKDRGPLTDTRKQERPAAKMALRPMVIRPRWAPRLQSQTYSAYPKQWGLPRHLTDGF